MIAWLKCELPLPRWMLVVFGLVFHWGILLGHEMFVGASDVYHVVYQQLTHFN